MKFGRIRMKRFLRTQTLALVALLLFALSARADLITLSISQPLTGTLDAVPFTSKLVTYRAMFTTDQLAACVASGFCNDNNPNNPTFFMDFSQGITATWTIESFGTFSATSNSSIIFHYNGSQDDPHNIVVDSGGDIEGRLGLPNPALPQDDCGGLIVCPVEAYTSGGTLIALGVDGPPTFSVEVTDNGVIPEPSTFVLLATGLSALGAAVSRRRTTASCETLCP